LEAQVYASTRLACLPSTIAAMGWVPPRLDRTVSVVTGASRGVGRGISLALGDAGATVYVTGRSTVAETAAEVSARGGRGIPLRVDHTDDRQVDELFARVREEAGRLDLVVPTPGAGTPTTTIAPSARRSGSSRCPAGRRCSRPDCACS
jgi:NAD(P)-dependent dehydrogenase (short-subunit alcohol dehydrogenase family)